MSRSVHMPEVDYSELVVPIENGGTAAISLTQAAQNLSVVTQSMIGMPGGPVPLNAQGQIPTNIVQSSVPSNAVNISSALQAVRSQSANFIISDYDSFKTYTITVSAGTVSRNGDTITFNAPAASQDVTMTINGRQFTIAVTGVVPTKPTLSAVASGGIGSTVLAYLSTGAYAISGSSDAHLNTDWQIATDAAFTNIVAQSIADATNKISTILQGLAFSTSYFARARHRSDTNTASAWSDTVNFTSAASYSLNTEEAKIAGTDRISSSNAGFSIDIDATGDRVIVGAPNQNGGFANSGAAYVFVRNGSTWTQEARLTSSDLAASNFLGRAVAIDDTGTRVVVSAPGNNSGATNKGAAYVFVRNTSTNVWTQEAKLIASDGSTSDLFGNNRSICIDSTGSRVAVGVTASRPGGLSNAGAVYIYSRSGTTWTQETKLTAATPAANAQFGCSVSLSNDGSTLVIGSLGETFNEPGFGEQSYTSAGTYTFTVPAGVTSISFVGIGAGAASTITTGGGGGGLAYKNNLAVNPGDQFTVVVGAAGQSQSLNGGQTTITKVGGGFTMTCPGGRGDGYSSSMPSGGDVNVPGSAGSITLKTSSGSTGQVFMGGGGIPTYTAGTPANSAPVQSSGGAAGPGSFTDGGVTYTVYQNNNSSTYVPVTGSNGTGPAYGGGGSVGFTGGSSGVEGYSSNPGFGGAARFVWGSGKTYPTNAMTTTGQGTVHVFARTGSSWALDSVLQPTVMATNSQFGSSVAISGDGSRIAVGTPNITYNGGTGMAYVYRKVGVAWTQESILGGSSRSASDFMGSFVALDGDGSTLVVGERAATVSAVTGAGAAYVYSRVNTTWTEQNKVSASDRVTSGNFGVSAALTENGLRMAIGSTGAQFSGTTMGAGYVYRK